MSKIVLVSNRLSTSVTVASDGSFEFKRSVGGLATGLSSLSGSEMVWVGWSGLTSDELTEAQQTAVNRTLRDEYSSVGVDLNSDEIESFYFGFCNKVIWPLFHYFLTYAEHDVSLWDSYVSVNSKFAERVLEIAEPGDLIWVHDYQLMLLPSLLKDRLPDATVGFFLHIPFPSYEIFRLLPWREPILDGLLGSDLVGFHTYDYARHFLSSVRRVNGLDHRLGTIRRDNRMIKVDVFPMGIDYEKYAHASEDPVVRGEIERLKTEFAGTKLILSVDRLDYSKGIPQRITAFRLLLERFPELAGAVSMVVIVSPSRTKVPMYAELKRELDEMVSSVNGEFGRIDWTPIRYFFRTFDFNELTALYARADLLLVTPLRDGMNLVAKEYIATRSDMKAVVVLSETAGAARELGEAIIVNATNTDQIAEAIRTGLEMGDEEKIEGNRAMQERLRRYDIHRWASDFVDKLNTAAQDQHGLRALSLSLDVRSEMIAAYRRGPDRLILLDYDGTLVPFADRPSKAAPDTELIQLLSRLQANLHTTLVVVSGRSRPELEHWFGGLAIGLVSDHGAWFRETDSREWHLLGTDRNDWKETIGPIMERYVDRTPGTFVEEKDFSLAWHYRRAEPELASVRVAELKDALLSLTANFDVSVLEGKRVLEVKNSGIDKGNAVRRWASAKENQFILSIGDDWTDEDMFAALPETAFTIKVGVDYSNARYFLESPSDVRKFLTELVSAGVKR